MQALTESPYSSFGLNPLNFYDIYSNIISQSDPQTIRNLRLGSVGAKAAVDSYCRAQLRANPLTWDDVVTAQLTLFQMGDEEFKKYRKSMKLRKGRRALKTPHHGGVRQLTFLFTGAPLESRFHEEGGFSFRIDFITDPGRSRANQISRSLDIRYTDREEWASMRLSHAYYIPLKDESKLKKAFESGAIYPSEESLRLILGIVRPQCSFAFAEMFRSMEEVSNRARQADPNGFLSAVELLAQGTEEYPALQNANVLFPRFGIPAVRERKRRSFFE